MCDAQTDRPKEIHGCLRYVQRINWDWKGTFVREKCVFHFREIHVLVYKCVVEGGNRKGKNILSRYCIFFSTFVL